MPAGSLAAQPAQYAPTALANGVGLSAAACDDKGVSQVLAEWRRLNATTPPGTTPLGTTPPAPEAAPESAATRTVQVPSGQRAVTPRDLLAEWRAMTDAAAADRPPPDSYAHADGFADARGASTSSFPQSGSMPSPGRYGGSAYAPEEPPGFAAVARARVGGSLGGSLGSGTLKSAIAPGAVEGLRASLPPLGQRLKKRVSFSDDNEVTLFTE